MLKPVKLEVRPQYRLYLEYSDGVAGEVDLSDLAGRGVFAAWNDEQFFRKAHFSASRHVSWDDDIELCANSLYLRLTGKTPEEVFPELRSETVGA